MAKENTGRKKVAVLLPGVAKQIALEERYSLELNGLRAGGYDGEYP